MNNSRTKIMERLDNRIAKPAWLKQRLPTAPEYEQVRQLVSRTDLHTVCDEARCPNKWECFQNRTATFLLMGPKCTRNCRFCAVQTGPDSLPDPDEPQRVAAAAAELGLNYVVLTSVTRDDLADGGASVFRAAIQTVRKKLPQALIEVLIPDFIGSRDALLKVVEADPDVLNHNIETVPRLYETVRPQAVYQRSLDLLDNARSINPDMPLKSGIMLGLGEADDEIEAVLADLYRAGCRILTMGQYLQPSKDHLPVARFVPPEEFDAWQERALSMGFTKAVCGPLVRSSYRASSCYPGGIDTMGKN